ncbi:MAG TPA: HAMP domain-containing protein, partial [Aeromicrobium sp.]|nr:HAMP domain-containing protein [Aeromicrobium sp.]
MGQRISNSLTRPLESLRQIVTRQRDGDTDARARVDVGVAEVRSLAVDFNDLAKTNLALSAQRDHMLAMRELQFDIERAVRQATDPESGFAALCQVLGAGLNVDHVIVYTLDRQGEVGLTSQWSGLGIATLEGPHDAILVDALESSNRLWAGAGRLIVPDVRQPEFQSRRGARELCERTNARSMILAPIGLVNRVDGIICVVHRG